MIRIDNQTIVLNNCDQNVVQGIKVAALALKVLAIASAIIAVAGVFAAKSALLAVVFGLLASVTYDLSQTATNVAKSCQKASNQAYQAIGNLRKVPFNVAFKETIFLKHLT